MTPDAVREFCLSLPHVTESIQWGNHLVLKVGGKMFVVAALEPSPVWISLKCNDEDFAELTERAGIIPAPYMARHRWIALENKDALTRSELTSQLRRAYQIVFDKLPKKKKEQLTKSH
jgi:predicted DNA-binding protein (MmcQ/YjbR family)